MKRVCFVCGLPLRFHGKMLLANELYKLTIKQTAGTGRVVPYSCSVQVLTA